MYACPTPTNASGQPKFHVDFRITKKFVALNDIGAQGSVLVCVERLLDERLCIHMCTHSSTGAFLHMFSKADSSR